MGKQGMLILNWGWGGSRRGRRREAKAAWWISMVVFDRRCIINVGEVVGCDEYID